MRKLSEHFTPYRGAPPEQAALSEFVTSTATGIGIGALAFGGLQKLAKQPGTYLENVLLFTRDKWMWGISAVFGAIYAGDAFNRARAAREQHMHLSVENAQLRNDNIAMRGQLNEAGQILRHVAGEIDKGTMRDSTIDMEYGAPPSHIVQAETAEASKALAEKAPHLVK